MVALKYIRGIKVCVSLHKGAEDKLGNTSGRHRESDLRSKLGTTFLGLRVELASSGSMGLYKVFKQTLDKMSEK